MTVTSLEIGYCVVVRRSFIAAVVGRAWLVRLVRRGGRGKRKRITSFPIPSHAPSQPYPRYDDGKRKKLVWFLSRRQSPMWTLRHRENVKKRPVVIETWKTRPKTNDT